jgi:hypothetical protein
VENVKPALVRIAERAALASERKSTAATVPPSMLASNEDVRIYVAGTRMVPLLLGEAAAVATRRMGQRLFLHEFHRPR